MQFEQKLSKVKSARFERMGVFTSLPKIWIEQVDAFRVKDL